LSFPFFLNATPTTDIYPLSLHDALPISGLAITTNLLTNTIDASPVNGAVSMTGPNTSSKLRITSGLTLNGSITSAGVFGGDVTRSEEHTSELQSQSNLVCRLLLEKKKHK